MKTLLSVILALTLSGCTGLNLFQVEAYDATLCGTGAVTIPCRSLGTVKVPAGAFVTTVLALAGPFLTRQANLKGCQFTAYPSSLEGQVITVTATATCKLNGVPVDELITLTLAPATP